MIKKFLNKNNDNSTSDTEANSIKRQSYLLPGVLVTTLFFLWGFSYGLLDTLNKHFRNVLDISTTQSTYMQVAYFGAYFVMSIPASLISKRFGYKRAMIFGLLLYVIGALCFYPSAIYLSFGGFVGSLFVIASGLSTLETCANTYIAIIGSRERASFRINAAQAFNGLASTIAPIVASYAFFGGTEDSGSKSLDSVKWTYIGVACGVFAIAVLFCFVNIPEVDEEALMAQDSEASGEIIRRASIYSPHLLLGALAQFMYVGAQVSVASMFMFYTSEVGHMPDSRGSIILSVGMACFTVGRFLSALLLKKFRPDHLMAIFATGAIIADVFVIAMKTPATSYALLVVVFFESIMFPTIFALGTKDLGRNHKRGSALIIMGVSGGAVLPPIQAVVHDHSNVNISYVIPLIAFCFVLFYSLVGCKWIKYTDDIPAAVDQKDVLSIEDEKPAVIQTEHKQTVAF
ncbi:MFS general substrate transporter [Rhizopus microsporus ATCC 52813]|uniref:MFS general substrate transporter n=1 Tax=Rhizopus microsporus ATCC 52813 TaxID=1340429 RepID=A0A2G4SGI3_RHIZD|nr:MFS general substrate transporter [Rhizopus microsporus ATCC 52813]PHZ07879.1 MFS general substrate transporter [Rhizopus microsporus ATCC 52813]